jgi:PadR family transcriptional regulator PadR
MATSALDLMPGTVDILVLRTLAWEAMHGYAISQFVRSRTGGAIGLESAALYQALHRLEKKRLVRSWWGVSETNRRAKDQSTELRAYVAALFAVLDAK